MTAWTILDQLGYTPILEELQGANLHRLENILTLDVNLQMAFDRLTLWFEAIGPNDYYVRTARGFRRRDLPQRVQFVTQRSNLPLPSPRHLQIHAACCRIAHLSGGAESLDKIYSDDEERGVLATDGSSAPSLDDYLRRLVPPG